MVRLCVLGPSDVCDFGFISKSMAAVTKKIDHSKLTLICSRQSGVNTLARLWAEWRGVTIELHDIDAASPAGLLELSSHCVVFACECQEEYVSLAQSAEKNGLKCRLLVLPDNVGRVRKIGGAVQYHPSPPLIN